MYRLVERHPASRRIRRPEGGRRQHAERPGEHGGGVRQHVAEQVVGDDDVELARIAHQLHGTVIGVHVGQLDVRVLGVVDGLGDLAPEDAAFHDVGFLDRADPVLAFARQVEGDADDPLDLGHGVGLGIDAAPGAVGQGLDAARLAEIDPGGQLANDHDVETLDHLKLQGRGLGKGVEDGRRSQVGEQVHLFTQAQKAALGLLLERQIVPLRPAAGTEEHRIAGQGVGHRLVGQGRPVGVDGGAADESLVDVEADRAAFVHPVDDPAHLAHHLGADPVAGKDQEFLIRSHWRFLLSISQPASQGWAAF